MTEAVAEEPAAEEPAAEEEPPKPKKKTRRGSRGGRSRKKKPAAAAAAENGRALSPRRGRRQRPSRGAYRRSGDDPRPLARAGQGRRGRGERRRRAARSAEEEAHAPRQPRRPQPPQEAVRRGKDRLRALQRLASTPTSRNGMPGDPSRSPASLRASKCPGTSRPAGRSTSSSAEVTVSTKISRSLCPMPASTRSPRLWPGSRSSSSPALTRPRRSPRPATDSKRLISPGCASRRQACGASTSSGSPPTETRGSAVATRASGCRTTR